MYMAHCVWASEILQGKVGGWVVVGPHTVGCLLNVCYIVGANWYNTLNAICCYYNKLKLTYQSSCGADF